MHSAVFSLIDPAYWWTGGRGAIGTNLEVSAYLPPTAGTQVAFSKFMLGTFLPTQVQIPGFLNQVGVNPLVDVWLGNHAAATGLARTSVPVPNDPALSGVVIPAQPTCSTQRSCSSRWPTRPC